MFPAIPQDGCRALIRGVLAGPMLRSSGPALLYLRRMPLRADSGRCVGV
jgi:hypothetical protein